MRGLPPRPRDRRPEGDSLNITSRRCTLHRVRPPVRPSTPRSSRPAGAQHRRHALRYAHFTTRQNVQFNWIPLPRSRRRDGPAGRRRHARHPDQRQLHPQHHQRRAGRRRAGRDRRPAPLREFDAPVEHAAPGVRLPAAQVQDRHHGARKTAPPSPGTTWACRSEAARGEVVGFQRAGGRRHGPHAGHRHGDPRLLPWQQILSTSRPWCASTTATAGATTLQGAHQDPGQGRGPEAFRRGQAGVRQILCDDADGTAHIIPRPSWPRGASFAPCRRRVAGAPRPCTGRERDWRFRAGWSATCARTKPRLPRRHAVAQARRPGARRRHRRPDGTDAAALAERFSRGELRVTHDQNLLLPWVRETTCPAPVARRKACGWPRPTSAC